ncbi:MAG: hypothetical protein HQK51_14750 [Oligoflexia bacterium]|nr:hypothetical protein [Oligoflexia bacterium]
MNDKDKKWEKIHLDILKRKNKDITVHDSKIIIKNYHKTKMIRQIVIKDHGRKQPTFILTNDFENSSKKIILKYARRWLVEKGISEEISFFHLNLLSSSMVIKVDFDLVMSLVANTLYKLLARQLEGHEKETAKTLYLNFIHNGADIEIKNKEIRVSLLKKAHNPIIMSTSIFKDIVSVPWLNDYKLKFSTQNTA